MIRSKFKIGQEIELLEDVENENSLTKGMKGKVLYVDDLGDVIVDWENGSSLNLIYGVDSFKCTYEESEISKENIINSMEKELDNDWFASLGYENVDGLKEFMKSFVQIVKETELTDDQVISILKTTDRVLEDLVVYMQSGKYPNDLQEYLNTDKKYNIETDKNFFERVVVNDYVAKVEKDYFSSVLYDKASEEYSKRYDEISNMTGKEALNYAYEIVFKTDILTSLEDADYLTTEQVKELIKLDSPLGTCYNEWLDNDCSHMEDLRDTIKETTERYSDNEVTNKTEYDFNNEMSFEM